EKVNYVSSTELKKLDIALVTNIDQYQVSDHNSYYIRVKEGLLKKGFRIVEILSESSYDILTKLRQFDYDYIINLINIELGNSKPSFHNLQAIEISGIPFTGATSFIARQLLDKIQIRKLLDFHDVPLPDWDYLFELEDEIKEELVYPLIVKPAMHDFKIGINNESLITKPEKLRPQIQKMMHYYNCPVVVEEFLEGDEYEVIVIGNDDNDLEALPLNKLTFPKGKLQINLGEIGHIKSSYPAKGINQKLEKLLIELSFDVFTILDCRDYARFDFRLDEDGNPSLIDVNVSPFIQYTTDRFDHAKLYEQILQKSVNHYRKQAVTMGKPRNE
ncbi:MAG: ATP-grasp domain-containing protein, partial [bacterium]|nr:ATP-grasp domain-containing protein [bacterium]